MNRENFNLTSIKLLGNGGVEATYTTKRETETTTNMRSVDITDDVIPHPDLKTAFDNEGVDFLARVLGFKDIGTKKKFDEAKERVSCHKFTISEKGDKKLLIVTGKLATGGSKIAINSPKKTATQNGYEIDMTEPLERLEDEAFAYFFEDKKAQLDIGSQLG